MKIVSAVMMLACTVIGSSASADDTGADFCSKEKVEAVEVALDEQSLESHCDSIRSEANSTNNSYAKFWHRSYNRKRNVGLGLTLLATPLFAAGAIAYWISFSRHSADNAETKNGSDPAEEFDRDLGLALGTIITAFTVGVLTAGVVLLIVGQKGMTALEPLVGGESDDSPLAIAPILGPPGPIGGGLRVEF